MYFKSSKYEPWHFFPSPIFVQILSNAKKWQHFKLQWTEFGQAVDFHVQSVSRRFWIWHKFDRDLTRLRQQLDKPSTWPISGLTLDRDLTMFGQRLDFLSSLCPTIQCQVVPICFHLLLCTTGLCGNCPTMYNYHASPAKRYPITRHVAARCTNGPASRKKHAK